MTEREVRIAREAYALGWSMREWLVNPDYDKAAINAVAVEFADAEYPLPPAKVWRCPLHGTVRDSEVVRAHVKDGWVCGPVEEVEA